MTTLFRSIKWAFRSFFRHLGLSFVTIIIITFSLLSLNILLFLNTTGQIMINNLQDKIDINVYLKHDASSPQIEAFRQELEKDPNIQEVTYVNPDQALAAFREKHKNDESIIRSLETLGKNPLAGMMIIKATSLENYQEVLNKITSSQYSALIEDKEFFEHRKMMSIIEDISRKVYMTGFIILIIFTLISVVAIFNSIRLTFYTRSDEIKIMRLIGATGAFTRAPLIIENILYGIFAWLINLILFFFILNFGLGKITNFLEIDLQVFLLHRGEIFLSFVVVLFFSIFLTIVSSWLATRKYIRV
jgi:cell division transport system permease protein